MNPSIFVSHRHARRTPIHLPVQERANTPIIVFATVCTDKRKAILCRPDVHDLILKAWRRADKWHVGRYVLMPDHLHFCCAPATIGFPSLVRWVQYWKSLCSLSWPNRDEQPIWKKSFWDTQLRRGEDYEQTIEYMLQNPVRKGLVGEPEEWAYQGELFKLDWYG
jgi:putative transposase